MDNTTPDPDFPPVGSVWAPDDDGNLHPDNQRLLKAFARAIDDDAESQVLAVIDSWPDEDIMDLLINLSLKRARSLYEALPPARAIGVLQEIRPGLRGLLLQATSLARATRIVAGLEEDEQVELLDDLPENLSESLLVQLPNAAMLRRRLEFEEDSAGSIMSNKFVAVLDDWDVGMAVRKIRRSAPGIEKLYEVYVVDESRKLVGTLKLRDLILNDKDTRIRDIQREVEAWVSADTDQEEVLELAERENLGVLPVVDEDMRVIGRITVEELQEIARDEADEDIKLMSGLGQDAQADESIGTMIRSRLPWLVGGLLGASLAGLVVGSFEDKLQSAAVLASFIPIVMAMAGNAGIQSSTITVQGLAAGNLWSGNLVGRLGKEVTGSILNGVAIALLLGGLIMALSTVVEIQSPQLLAMSAGLSVASVIVMAALIGATVPILLHRIDIDPAVATGVFITTWNDIFGVVVFFVIASAVYL